MAIIDGITLMCLIIGLIFFVGGAVGILRFPDIYTRLHALTKADNIGLGFIILGLLVQIGEFGAGIKVILIWILVVFSSATVCHIIGRAARRMGIEHWRKL